MSVSNRSANQNTARQLNHNVGFFFFLFIVETVQYKKIQECK